MATHRAHNLIHVNPVLWLGEVKRLDSRITSRVLFLKALKASQHRPRLPRYNLQSSVNKSPTVLRSTSIATSWPSVSVFPAHQPSLVLSFSQSIQQSSAASPNPAISSPSQDPEKPSTDQLQHVYDSIQTNLPRVFTNIMDYRIYSQDVVLINNIHNKTTRGLFKYVQQVALLRLIGHLKFAYVKVELVSMSQHHMEGRITVKWRIVGISGLRVMLKFWKFKLWKWDEIMKQTEVWHDIISHFDVGPDGFVYRHIVDKIEEDKEHLEDGKRSKSSLLAKLALIAALFPRNELGEAITCNPFLQTSTTAALNNSNITGEQC